MKETDVIRLDLRQHDAPCRVAEALSHVSVAHAAEIVVEDVDPCPNRIVP